MDKNEQFQTLANLVRGIEKGTSEWKKCQSDPHCDKKGVEFGTDERFSTGGTAHIRLVSWRGYYGSSSCSNVFNLPDSFAGYVKRYLNSKKFEVLDWIREEALRDLSSLKQSRLDELQKQIDEVHRLTDPVAAEDAGEPEAAIARAEAVQP